MSSPYVVFAEIVARPEHLAATRAAVQGLIAPTLDEPGCDMFGVHQAADGSPRLFLYERWRDEAAFTRHHAQAHVRAVFARYDEWLAAPPRLTVVTDIL